MTNRGFGDDGTIDDLPWASVFDPAANARALSAIQAEGLRAASRIVDRVVRAVGSEENGQPSAEASNGKTLAAAGTDTLGPAGLPEFERLTRAWWSMVGQLLLRSIPPTPAARGVLALDLNNPDAHGVLALEAAVAGSAGTEIWLHNRGPADHADVRLQCSDLLGHDGDVISADAVRIDTAVVPMPRRSSRGVVVTVDVSSQVRPGVYRGTLVASGHPDLWLPVVLTVRLPDT
ncbi:hypothetical protein A5707_09140 [Mycobacterium kyorinense]|uniref:Uncharacterized protein n=1 Tax=Mycobacterium kyorinense TaxID=487514 RepID=A0A1A2YUG7_9MYCO|nr:hypothetical protein [Mycobacterium kyorinense]OBI40571.1 hypothetical protein A5707_09140 [Mycobacterium kyorinense]